MVELVCLHVCVWMHNVSGGVDKHSALATKRRPQQRWWFPRIYEPHQRAEPPTGGILCKKAVACTATNDTQIAGQTADSQLHRTISCNARNAYVFRMQYRCFRYYGCVVCLYANCIGFSEACNWHCIGFQQIHTHTHTNKQTAQRAKEFRNV